MVTTVARRRRYSTGRRNIGSVVFDPRIARAAVNVASRAGRFVANRWNNIRRITPPPEQRAMRPGRRGTVPRAPTRGNHTRSAPPAAGYTGPGKSAGFLKTGRVRIKKLAKTGINFTGEYGGSKTSLDMAIVGHSTLPVYRTMRMVYYAVVKQLLRDAGITVTGTGSPYLPFRSHGGETDRFRVYYQDNLGASIGADELGLTSTTDIDDIVDWLENPARGWNDLAANVAQASIQRFEYVPVSEPAGASGASHIFSRYSMLKADQLVITVKSKSSFKMQNRSVTTAGDTEESVDSVPLHGKSYEGKGSGPSWIGREGQPTVEFIAHRATGCITLNSGTNLREPPPYTEFEGVVKGGKIKLDPGELKTSVMTDTESHYFNTWLQKINQAGSYTTSSVVSKIGKFRFFCIEKMLDPDQVGNIKTAFEHNLFMSSQCKKKTVDPTIMLHDSLRNIT